MPSGYQDLINFITDGEQVKAGVANRAPRALDQNIRYLKDLLALVESGQIVVALNRPVAPDVLVGHTVYFKASQLRFERAIARAEIDPLTGVLALADSSRVWGVVMEKPSSLTGNILLSGLIDLPMSQGISGTIVPGPYWLSATEPGQVTAVRPPVGVNVLEISQEGAVAGTWEVLVRPQQTDFLDSHRHFSFPLVAAPAGDHAPPDFGDPHIVTSPDPGLEGWLPAGHAVFAGHAPAGAAFGYNLSVSQLGPLWPPVPIENTVLTLLHQSAAPPLGTQSLDLAYNFATVAAQSFQQQDFPAEGVSQADSLAVTTIPALSAGLVVDASVPAGGTIRVRLQNLTAAPIDPALTTFRVLVSKSQGSVTAFMPGLQQVPPELCVIDIYGIWWMTDCYNQVPWPASLDTDVVTSLSAPGSCPAPVDMRLSLWWTNNMFFTQDSAVLSLRGRAGSGITFYCAGTDDERVAGHLEADLDLALLIDADDDPGHLAIKNVTDNKFQRGPVVASIKSGSPELLVTSDVPVGEDGGYSGQLVLTANLDLVGYEFPVYTVRLDGVEQEFFQDVLALGFPTQRASEFRGAVRLPSRVSLPETAQLKLRFWFMGRGLGTIPANMFTLSYRILPRPATLLSSVISLPLVDSPLGINTLANVTANQYFEAESAPFDVTTGDVIMFTLGRNSPDAYAADVHLLDQIGVLVLSA